MAVSVGRKPMQLAQTEYIANGLVLDFVALPNSPLTTTFESGETYYIPTSYTTGSSVIFEPGSVIKYKDDAYMILYGSISFPTLTHQTPVFTSKDDNAFGEMIQFYPSDPNDPDSDGDPSDNRASQAIWIYYSSINTEIRNARIRWAQRAIQYDTSVGSFHYLTDCLIENTDTGVNVNSSGSVTLSGIKKYSVTTPISGTGSYYGNITDAKFYTEKSFKGIPYFLAQRIPPDSMGAVGQYHFVEIVNGYIRVFNKTTGAPVSGEGMTLNTFFGATGLIFDPRIVYDAASQRWIACSAHSTGSTPLDSSAVKLAVSKTSNPTSLSSNWDVYSLNIGEMSTWFTDWPALAVDANGVYITAAYYNDATGALEGNKVVGIKKSDLYSGTLTFYAKFVSTSELNANTIFPAFNHNSSPSGGYAWFIARLKSSGTGSSYQPGGLRYRRASWSSGQFDWVDLSWQTVSGTSPRYFAVEDAPVTAPQAEDPPTIDFSDSRLMSAVIRGTNLWTCHTVGLDGTDGDYDGTETGSTVDRTGIQWWKLGMPVNGSSITSNLNGLVFDNNNSPTNVPYWFYTPSLAVNSSGHTLIGFSGSKEAEYIGAFYYGRLSNGTAPDRVTLIQPGALTEAGWQTIDWGDYSATMIDPDDSTFWTVQEYTDGIFNEGEGLWGTWITSVKVQ